MPTAVPYKIYKPNSGNGRPDLLPDLNMTNSAYTRSQMTEITPDDFLTNYYSKDKDYYDSYYSRNTTPGMNEAFQQIISGGASNAPIKSGYVIDDKGTFTSQSAIDESARLANDPNMVNIGTPTAPLYVPKGSPGETNYNQNIKPNVQSGVLNPTGTGPGPNAPAVPPVPQTPTIPILPPSSVPNAPTPTGPSAGPSGNAPVAPNLSGLENEYRALLGPSAEEQATQAEIDRLIQSRNLGLEKNRTEPKAMKFIQGEEYSRLKGANLAIQPLEQKAARMQAQRQASLEASRFNLERADRAAEIGRDESRYQTEVQRDDARYQQNLNVDTAQDLQFKDASKPFYFVGNEVRSKATHKGFANEEEAWAAGVAKDFSNVERPSAAPTNTGSGSTTSSTVKQEQRVKQIIALHPGEWGHAADQIDREFGPGTATKYDDLLKAAYGGKGGSNTADIDALINSYLNQ